MNSGKVAFPSDVEGVTYNKAEFPISFPQNESKDGLLTGRKVKCEKHGWKDVSEKDFLTTPESGKSDNPVRKPFEEVQFVWSIHKEVQKLLSEYNSGKLQSFAVYVNRLLNSYKKLSISGCTAASVETTIKLPCGCKVPVVFGGEVDAPPEPKLEDVLLKLGLKAPEDLNLLAANYFLDEGKTELVMDRCKAKADSIIKTVETAKAELNELDKFSDSVKAVAEQHKFIMTDLKSRIITFIGEQTREAKKSLKEAIKAQIDDLIEPLTKP